MINYTEGAKDNRKMMTKSNFTPICLGFMGMLLCFASSAEILAPLAPLPFTVPGNSEREALGERLFHDRRLSGHGQRSCASCHPLDRGAMDGRIHSQSADGISSLRNTPTLFNVAFNYFYNWDGAETTLEAHLDRVLLNPKIMNITWPALLEALQADADYVQAFGVAYPAGLNRDNVIDALTRFERGLITPNARFDRFLLGEKNALNADEQQGYQLFKSLGCVACHQGMNIGGNLFQKFGIFGIPKGNSKVTDDGRYNVTKNDRDRGVYRVPSLRNVAITAPYFHDGRAATLEEAVDTMARDQLGKPLTTKDRTLIIKFLYTLTGEYLGKPVIRDTMETQ